MTLTYQGSKVKGHLYTFGAYTLTVRLMYGGVFPHNCNRHFPIDHLRFQFLFNVLKDEFQDFNNSCMWAATGNLYMKFGWKRITVGENF